MPNTMVETAKQPSRISNTLLITLAIIAAIGLLAAWDAMARYATIIAAIYATATIIAAGLWLALIAVRVICSIRTYLDLQSLNKVKVQATEITLARETRLEETRILTDARQMQAAARKAEREAELTTIIANRDQQILISDGDGTRRFTAAHLQTSGQVNGKPTPPTPQQTAAWAAFHSRSQATTTPQLLQEPAAPAAELPPIIPALVNRQRILIVGASDSGKTTLLRWLIEARGKCLVIDPQGSPGKWGRATMLGEGLNYPLIATTLGKLAAEMKRRHGEIGTGEVLEGQHETLTIIIDDLRGIVINCKDTVKNKTLAHLITDGRSTGLNLIIGTHSRYVKPLGLEGEGDLRKGLVIAELQGGNGEEQWSATLEFNADKNKIPHRLPGPHPVIEEMKAKAKAAKKISTDLVSILADNSDAPPEPTPKQKRAETIRTLYNKGDGLSKTEIAQELGYKANEGAIFYQIKAALAATTTTTK